MNLQDNDGIFLAGSTHRGEEEFVLQAFKAVRKNHPKARLVIAPRELLRTMEVTHICKSAGFTVSLRTELQQEQQHGAPTDIVILDTIGELGKVYSIGDVVYVGGSLITHGGHNILEPAAHGKAIIVGHYMFNFKDTHALFKKRNACLTVENAEELARETARLFDEPEERHRMEAETLAIVSENKGASRKSAVILRETIERFEREQASKGSSVKSTQKIANLQTYFVDLVHSKDVDGIWPNILMGILYVFSLVYRGLVNFKLALFKLGLFRTKQLDCFVISLGNITVGGTGKTPTAQRLAKDIRDMGYKVVILNRGYRAKWHGQVGIVSDGRNLHMTAAEAGDEAFMLAKHLPEVPVLIGAERAETGRYAIEHFGAEVAILDDGYQHWQLARDMDILLVDAVNVFGNGYMLPRGTLREPMPHLNRSHVCLMTKVDQAAAGSREYIRDTIAHYNQEAKIVESIHQPRCFIPLSDWYVDIAGDGIPVTEMKDRRIVAVSAIGNPASFEQTLEDLGTEIIESLRYPDHHDYTMQEMQDVLRRAESQGAEAIVITEKDAVKIPAEVVQARWPIPVYVICVEVNFQEGGEEFYSLLKAKLQDKLGKR